MRAIDADVLLKRLDDLVDWCRDIRKIGLEQAMYIIQEMPTLTPPNEPLTLEQLQEMNEEPVWVQNLEEPEKSQWRLLYWDRGKYLVLQGISVRGYLLEEYGESWLVYRRPPEGEEDT